MDTYWKTVCLAVIGVVLCLIMAKNAKDHTTVVVIMLCCGICSVAVGFLSSILQLLNTLAQISGTGSVWMEILLKSVGLSIIGDTVSNICSDAGQASVGKTLQLLTTVVIMWISLPLIRHLLELIQSILEML